MKISGNCRSSKFVCPFFRRALYHPGFTGKSGSEASCHCARSKKVISVMKECKLVDNPERQRVAWLAAEEAKRG